MLCAHLPGGVSAQEASPVVDDDLRHEVYPLPDSWLLKELGHTEPLPYGIPPRDSPEDKRSRERAVQELEALRVPRGRFKGWFDVSAILTTYLGTAVPEGGWIMWNERERTLSVNLLPVDLKVYKAFFGTKLDKEIPWIAVVHATLVAWTPSTNSLSAVLEGPLTLDELEKLAGGKLEVFDRQAVRGRSGNRAKVSSKEASLEVEPIACLGYRYVDVNFHYERQSDAERFELTTAISVANGGEAMVELGYGGTEKNVKRIYYLIIGADVLPENEKPTTESRVKK